MRPWLSRLTAILVTVAGDGLRLLDEVALRCLRIGDQERHSRVGRVGLVHVVRINLDRHLLLQPVRLGPLVRRLGLWLTDRGPFLRLVTRCWFSRSSEQRDASTRRPEGDSGTKRLLAVQEVVLDLDLRAAAHG
jgi:hypothetical protein